jgi:hypothetical protein
MASLSFTVRPVIAVVVDEALSEKPTIVAPAAAPADRESSNFALLTTVTLSPFTEELSTVKTPAPLVSPPVVFAK